MVREGVCKSKGWNGRWDAQGAVLSARQKGSLAVRLCTTTTKTIDLSISHIPILSHYAQPDDKHETSQSIRSVQLPQNAAIHNHVLSHSGTILNGSFFLRPYSVSHSLVLYCRLLGSSLETVYPRARSNSICSTLDPSTSCRQILVPQASIVQGECVLLL